MHFLSFLGIETAQEPFHKEENFPCILDSQYYDCSGLFFFYWI